MVEKWSAEDLRRLAREDEEARRLSQEEGDNDDHHAATEEEDSSLLYRVADGRTILNYAAFLGTFWFNFSISIFRPTTATNRPAN
jgi:hypothetical protein